MCSLRLLASVKVLLHCVQPKGFSPEWVNMCFFMSPAVVQEKSHYVQLYGLSPGWVSNKHVCPEATSCCAAIVALCAIERFVSWMSLHVCPKVPSCCAGIVTPSSAEKFSWMGWHVFLEVTSLCAGVVALCATKRLLSTMNQHVPFQLRERFTKKEEEK